jgi:antitoxin component YwqK of YwqJK toxin-antitoxin module
MKKTALLIGLFLISISAFSQESERLNYIDAKGMKQGHWIAKTDKGLLKYDGFFKDNKPVGVMKRYDEWGILKAELRYDATGATAYAKLLYEGSQIGAEGKYVNEKKDSIWKYYSYYSKQIVAEENFSNGVRQGISKTYYSNGKVSEELEFDKGKKSGIWKQYFDDGTLKLNSAYSDDKKTGPYLYNFPNGKTESTGFYRNDKMDGWWTYYNEDSSVKAKIEYVDGLPKDPSVLQKYEQEFFKKVDENKGKIPELQESDLMPDQLKR